MAPKVAATTPRTFFQLQCRHQLPLRRGGRPPGPSQSPPPGPFLRRPLRPGPLGVSQSPAPPTAFLAIRPRIRPTRLSSQSSGLVPLRPDRPNGRSQPSAPPIPFRRSRSLRSSLTSRRRLPDWAAAPLREERPPRSSREPSRPGRGADPRCPSRSGPGPAPGASCRDRYPFPARPSAGAPAGLRRCDRSSLSRALPRDDRPCACWPRPPPLLRPPGLRS